MKIGHAYAYGIGLPLPDAQKKIRAAAAEKPNALGYSATSQMELYFSILNYSEDEDWLIDAYSPIAAETSIREYRDIPARKPAKSSYLEPPKGVANVPIDEVRITARRPIVKVRDEQPDEIPLIEFLPWRRVVHLDGVNQVFALGDLIPLELEFEKAGKVSISVQVRPQDTYASGILPWPDCN
jgi:hypothetical protein